MSSAMLESKCFQRCRAIVIGILLAYAGQCLGDVPLHNFHIGYAPIQERAEWLIPWSKEGSKPVGMIEYVVGYFINVDQGYKPVLTPDGYICNGRIYNFWNRNSYFLTEYAAAYLGDFAYQMEGSEYADMAAKKEIFADYSTEGFERDIAVDMSMLLDAKFIEGVYRPWRALGLNGGAVPWFWGKNIWGGIIADCNDVNSPPTWANVLYTSVKRSLAPLIVIISGSKENPADLTHIYYANEDSTQYAHAVFDGPGRISGSLKWTYRNVEDGTMLAEGNYLVDLSAGDRITKSLDIKSKALPCGKVELCVAWQGMDGRTLTEKRILDILYRSDRPINKIKVFDPMGDFVKWPKNNGIKTVSWAPGEPLTKHDSVVLGPFSLRDLKVSPISAKQIRNGLKVLVMEQDPRELIRMGFRIQDVAPRYS